MTNDARKRHPWTLVAVAALVATALAGCSSSDGAEEPPTGGTPTLLEGRGGIDGLLIDDVYRPISGGLIFLQGVGLTATTDDLGQFRFTDLLPDSYVAVVSAVGHEASPVNIDVRVGMYTEADIEARRIFSEDGRIITTQYSVFVPCAVGVIAASFTFDCTGDTSGDTFRTGFVSNYTGYDDATYLVTEMKANHKASSSQGAFKVVVRERGNGDYWASKFTVDSDYLKLTMLKGNVSLDDTESRNAEWKNDKHMETLLFPQGTFKSETQTVLDAGCGVQSTSCFESRGLGPQAGIKANFVQSLFLGEPDVDIAAYHVLSPSP